MKIINTKDGSNTLFLPELNECYHSRYGAFQESMHIFINNGCKSIHKNEIRVFEVGFGTGLNTILTISECLKKNKKCTYTAVELHPLTVDIVKNLNFHKFIEPHLWEMFLKIHGNPWNEKMGIMDGFLLHKINKDILEITVRDEFDIIYFDAFAPDIQPELWTVAIFEKMNTLLAPGGVLVTYSTKGTVKQALKSAGFHIEKFKGPPGGKRENLKAIKVH